MSKSKIILSPRFLKELERLERKYPRVIDEVTTLVSQLEQGQQPGDKITGLGYDAYKVRLRNPSSGRGKRGGFRVIYYVYVAGQIFMLSIYSKTQQEDISLSDIKRAIESTLSDES
jgi:mRNA-degrading endonuclease RelE of RelBE toxin-antitoxin system